MNKAIVEQWIASIKGEGAISSPYLCHARDQKIINRVLRIHRLSPLGVLAKTLGWGFLPGENKEEIECDAYGIPYYTDKGREIWCVYLPPPVAMRAGILLHQQERIMVMTVKDGVPAVTDYLQRILDKSNAAPIGADK